MIYTLISLSLLVLYLVWETTGHKGKIGLLEHEIKMMRIDVDHLEKMMELNRKSTTELSAIMGESFAKFADLIRHQQRIPNVSPPNLN